MVGHGGSSAGSYLADPTSPIPSHCASIVATSTVRVKGIVLISMYMVLPYHFLADLGQLYKIQDSLLSFCAYNYTHMRLFMQKVYKNIIYISIQYKLSNIPEQTMLVNCITSMEVIL